MASDRRRGSARPAIAHIADRNLDASIRTAYLAQMSVLAESAPSEASEFVAQWLARYRPLLGTLTRCSVPTGNR